MNIDKLSTPNLEHSGSAQGTITTSYKSDERRMVIVDYLVLVPLRPINLPSVNLLGTWFNETDN